MIFRIEYRIKLNSFKVPTYVLPPPPFPGGIYAEKDLCLDKCILNWNLFNVQNFLENFIKQIIFTYPWSPKNNHKLIGASWEKIHEYYLFYFKATL